MNRRAVQLAAAAILAPATLALGQPILNALGGTPFDVSNPTSGTTYISGSGSRWSLSGASLSFSTIPNSGGGLISADGAYQTCTATNGGSIVGFTGVCSPAFTIPTAFANFTLPASGSIAARYSAAGGTVAGLPGIPNDAYSQSYQVFGSGDSGNVHTPTCMSPNGRFIGVQSYISTYNTSTTTLTVTNVTCASDVATVTTTAAHLMAPGNPVTISGNSVAAYNGTFTVVATPTATTFTFASVGCTGTGTGGSISLPAGTRVVASSTFRFRGGIWDGNTNTMRTLPAPFRTSTQTTRRRDTTVWAVSDDGTVVLGAQEHNSGGGIPTVADPDGARLVVWRWNGSDYVMSYLPMGTTDGSPTGFPLGLSTSLGTCHMNGAGTVIVAPAAADVTGAGYLAKWTWNAGTSSWNAPVALDATPLGTAASWLPFAVTSCGLPPTLNVTGMSEDGNTVVGFATYSTCGSFMRGGWIWTAASGEIVDWYDYLAAQGVVGTTIGPGSTWGPIGDALSISTITCSGGIASVNTGVQHAILAGDQVFISGNSTAAYNGMVTVTNVTSTTSFEFAATCGVDGSGGTVTNFKKGMPRVGNPSGISPDGSIVVGSQGGNQVIIGAPTWVLTPAGSPCIAPQIASNPNATANFSRCNRFVNLSCSARGSSISFQWYRANGGSPIALTDGVNANGMQIIGAQTAAPTLIDPTPADADNYYCVVTGPCGAPAQTTNCTVQFDPTVPALAAPAFSSCAAADASAGVGTGTYSFNPCGMFDTAEAVSCITAPGVTTRSAVWFKYVPTADGEARFQTCLGGYDSNITLWSTCGAQLACNDDVGSGVPSCSSTRSRIARINVFTGVPVLVRVAGTGTAISATGSLQIIQPAPARPANDDCSNATVVSIPTPIAQVAVNAAPIAYDLTEATDDGAASCSATSFRSVWYSFTPAHRGVIRVSTCTASPQVDTVLSIQRGSCFSPIELACNDNQTGAPAPCGSSQSVIDNFTVTNLDVGAPLYFRVAQKSLSTTLTGQFSFRFTATCPADYDGDGSITPADVASFVNAWFASLTAGNMAGDFDGNGSVNPADVAAFVNAWFAALSNPC